MTRRVPRDRFEAIFLIAVLLWGLYIIVESVRFEEFFAWALPILVAVPMVGLILLLFGATYSDAVRTVVSRIRLDQSVNIEDVDITPSYRDISVFVGTTVLYILLAVMVGFFYAMPIYLYLFFRLYDSYDRRTAIAVTAIVWLGTSFVLGTIFDIPGIYFGPFSRVSVF